MTSLNAYGVLLLWDTESVSEENLADLRARGVPIIDLMPPILSDVPCITADRESAFRLATRHAVDLGHRRIGIILNLESRRRTGNAKLAGYKAELDLAGIPFDADLIEDVDGVDIDCGYDAHEALAQPPSGCNSGRMPQRQRCARGDCAQAGDMGVRVPEEVSVSGYGASSPADIPGRI